MSGRWIVRCRVSGGVTGTRESVVNVNGQTKYFDTEADARAEAASLVERMNTPRSTANFQYWPDEERTTHDTFTPWEGAEPVDERLQCFDHDVIARTVRRGVLFEGSASLGGSWYDLADASEPNQECIREISGYLSQMIDEALAELDRDVRG